jgi:hypothetical protein
MLLVFQLVLVFVPAFSAVVVMLRRRVFLLWLLLSWLLRRSRVTMRLSFAVMHLSGGLATANVIHLLRFQRSSWMLL